MSKIRLNKNFCLKEPISKFYLDDQQNKVHKKSKQKHKKQYVKTTSSEYNDMMFYIVSLFIYLFIMAMTAVYHNYYRSQPLLNT